jgi:hypothetical protein
MACGGSHHGLGNGGCCEMGEPASLLFDATARNDQHEHVERYWGYRALSCRAAPWGSLISVDTPDFEFTAGV